MELTISAGANTGRHPVADCISVTHAPLAGPVRNG